MAFINHTKGALKGAPKVFIAIPTYTGKLDNSLVHSLIEALPLFEKEQIGFEFFTLSFHCHVDDARNEIVAKFLESDCDSLIFIDSDVSFGAETLVRLAKHDRGVIAGVYPKRTNSDLEFPVLLDEGKAIQADEQGLVEVVGAPTGFMKIKRHVLEALKKANAHRTYMKVLPTTIIFERTEADNQRFSGDYSFCRAWRKQGGKIFVDPEMRLTHTGEAQFSGTLGDHWKEKHGLNQELKERRFNRAVENLRVGLCTEEDIAHLIDGWGNPYAASSSLLIACYFLAKNSKGSALEAGSGLSSLVMALANPSLTIHCLEHEIIWASRLKEMAKVHNVGNIVVHFVDLKKYDDGDWYDVATLPKEKFSLALCDGPPRRISNRSIFWNQLSDQIADAVLVMDDADNDALIPMKHWATNLGRDVRVMGHANHPFAVSPVGASQ